MRYLAWLLLLTVCGPGCAEPFGLRGIKGLWWDGAEKYKDIMKWMPEHHFNFLMFCYSSFPGSGMQWREPYSSTELQDMKEISDYCRAHGIDLCLSINPGIWSKPPLSHSGDDDYRLLCEKLASVHELGIDWFALCLDDISRELLPEDRERFGTLAAAQAHLVNRLHADLRRLDPEIRLIFCPSAYTTADALAHLDYITAIGSSVHPRVYMFWTGPEVCSREIGLSDALQFTMLIRRKPIIWDNYPVNDYASWYPILGPLRNRHSRLGEHVVGLMSNPMKQEEASKLPLATIGDYLAAPRSYDPKAAIGRAIDGYTDSAGARAALRRLVSIYGSKWLGEGGFAAAEIPKDPSRARTRLSQLRSALRSLRSEPSLAHLRADIEPSLMSDIQLLARRIERASGRATVYLTGIDFEGGAAELFGTAKFGEPEVNYVYAQSTGRHAMTAAYVLSQVPDGRRYLLLRACDDDFPDDCPVRISINGAELFSGPSGYPDASWADRRFAIPDGALTAGANRITIENTAANGTLGMPPWFMVARVEITAAPARTAQ